MATLRFCESDYTYDLARFRASKARDHALLAIHIST